MPERSFSSPSYRYGFNGMEKDDEMKNVGGASYDFGARMYDSRLGRWMSVDPLAKDYPSLSPYDFVDNRPVLLLDPDGKQITIYFEDEEGFLSTYVWNYGEEYDGTIAENGVGNEFVKETVKSLNFLVKTDATTVELESGKKINYLKTLAEAPIGKVDLAISEGERSDGVYNDEFNFAPVYVGGELKSQSEISFITDMGVKSKDREGNDVKISPAVGLGHELGHAFRYYLNASKNKWNFNKANRILNAKLDTRNKVFGNQEEQENITTFEYRCADVCGKEAITGKRYTHEGESYTTTGSTTVEEAPAEVKTE